MTETGEPMFDVVAVNIQTRIVRVMASNLNDRDADAYVNLAVMRRGVEDEFFAAVPTGTLHNGDAWERQA